MEKADKAAGAGAGEAKANKEAKKEMVKEADKKASKGRGPALVDIAVADEIKKAAGDAGRALEAMADLFEEREESAVAREAGAVDEATKQPECERLRWRQVYLQTLRRRKKNEFQWL